MTTILEQGVDVNPKADPRVQAYARARLRVELFERAWKEFALRPNRPFMVVFRQPEDVITPKMMTLYERVEITDMSEYVGIDWGIEEQTNEMDRDAGPEAPGQ